MTEIYDRISPAVIICRRADEIVKRKIILKKIKIVLDKIGSV